MYVNKLSSCSLAIMKDLHYDFDVENKKNIKMKKTFFFVIF